MWSTGREEIRQPHVSRSENPLSLSSPVASSTGGRPRETRIGTSPGYLCLLRGTQDVCRTPPSKQSCLIEKHCDIQILDRQGTQVAAQQAFREQSLVHPSTHEFTFPVRYKRRGGGEWKMNESMIPGILKIFNNFDHHRNHMYIHQRGQFSTEARVCSFSYV